MSTKDRLAEALRAAGLDEMAEKAARGHYDDFESPLPFPMLTLVAELGRIGGVALRLRDRVMAGDFDATPEEAEAWAKSAEGQETLHKLMPRGGRK